MPIDSYIPDLDNAESGGNSAESARESSETSKKSRATSAAGAKRTKKDEKKARGYDFLLANLLVEIIISKKYDFLLDQIFDALNAGYGSNFILGILSLVYQPISDKIRLISEKPVQHFTIYRKDEPTEFDDKFLDTALKGKIQYWIEDIIDSVTIESSSLVSKKILKLLAEENQHIYDLANDIFIYYFHSLNISISKNKAKSYTQYILGEVHKELKKRPLEQI